VDLKTTRKVRAAARFQAALALFVGVAALWTTALSRRLLAAGNPVSAAAAWGSDHVGQAVPEYVTGDECLFCHRDRFGTDWGKNAHQRTVRPADPSRPEMAPLREDASTKSLADQVELVLGDRRQLRYLKKSDEYGKLEMLTAAFTPPPAGRRNRRLRGKLSGAKDAHWDEETFGARCAGCHATAVDAKTHAFAAISLDCFTCHGVVDLRHSKDTKLVHFGKGRNDPPRVVASICGQCHLRNGKSKSTGLPYPNTFVAGDNLFRDFQAGLSDKDLASMDPADRHVARSVREMLADKTQASCLACHDVHSQSTTRHRTLAESAICADCHQPGKPKNKPIVYEGHSPLCGY
jgi:hypothetical protein